MKDTVANEKIVDLETHPADYVTLRELAEYFQFDRRTVLSWIKTGRLRGELVDEAWRIATADARAYVARHRREGKPEK